MEITFLVEIACEVRDSIKNCMERSSDYGEAVTQRRGDVTRKIDLVAEDALETALEDRGVSARVISEEKGDRKIGKNPEFLLVFDPVDGSTNATCGIPYFCTSLAYTPKIENAGLSDITIAVVAAIQGDTYHAKKGGGAYLNSKKIEGKKGGTRTKPVISLYTYGVPSVPRGVLELQKNIIVRTLGSMALDMCLVADGTLDGVMDTRGHLHSYDIAASRLILLEAGGLLTTPQGKPLERAAGDGSISLLGTKNPGLHQKIVEILKRK